MGDEVVEDELGVLEGFGGGAVGDGEFGGCWGLVGGGDAGEVGDLAGSGFFVEAFGVAGFAGGEGGVDEDLDEGGCLSRWRRGR